jgi:hypothetical protein
MSIVLLGSTSGSCTLQEQAVAGTTVLTLPTTSGTVLTTTSPKVGNVIQVVQSVKTTLQSISTTAGTYYDISDLSVSITPTSSSSKILVMFNIGACGTNSTGDLIFRLNRNATVIAVGQSSATFTSAAAVRTLNSELSSTPSMTFLDSPATTSSTTYKVTGANTSNGTMTINGRQADSAFCTVSSITVMEIAA